MTRSMTRSAAHVLRDATLLALVQCLAACATSPGPKSQATGEDSGAVYPTYGVHNNSHSDRCEHADCTYRRKAGEPADPTFPIYWSSHWNMYRVFNNYQNHLPPYDREPPPELVKDKDYTVSQGATYYDSTWKGASGQGAMMEKYEKHCLPIFPMSNDFSCAFISLGKLAFFLTYPEDRPQGMPPVCLFSPDNQPPGLDFIKHLPYAAADGKQLDDKVLGYSFWVDHETGKPIQVGASPDQTDAEAILFGYAFESTPRPDSAAPVAPYRHPHSFYFSGVASDPPRAPIVSQNYTDFAMKQPDPAETWAQVSGLDPDTLPTCRLFDPPNNGGPHLLKSGKPVPTWGTIGRGSR